MSLAGRDLVVLNPGSAGGDGEFVRGVIREKLPEAVVWSLGPEEDVRAEVAQAIEAGCARVIAAGGDGTVAGVANGMLHSNVPLGVIPLGTGNLFAREMGLPLDIEAACELLAQGGRAVPADAMRVNGAITLTHVGLGLYSILVEEPHADLKRLLGPLAYLGGLLRGVDSMLRKRTWRIRAEIDGKRRKLRASLVIAANAGATPIDAFRIGPHVTARDGRLDLCVFRGRTVGEVIRAIGRVTLLKKPFPAKTEYFGVYKTLKIESRRRLQIRTDLPLEAARELYIENLPAALRVVVPPSPKMAALSGDEKKSG